MEIKNNLRLDLSTSESNVLKGLALLFLLIHHLFYIRNGKFDDIEISNGKGIVNMIGLACKVCVPMFVFLSGYGLTAVAERAEKINLKKFYIKRFSKLYLNYWFIWILFVPIGIFFFDITFDKVYGDHTTEKLILDFWGLINITGRLGYNPTWWFYSCIIILYLVFPFILAGCKNRLFTHLILWVSVALVFCPIVYVQPIRYYLLTFILGCYFRNGLIYILLPPPLRNWLIGRYKADSIHGRLLLSLE